MKRRIEPQPKKVTWYSDGDIKVHGHVWPNDSTDIRLIDGTWYWIDDQPEVVLSDTTIPEPPPTEAEMSKPVSEVLKGMIDQRTALGIKKYGTPLKTFNGRNAMMDALQESVDLNQYLCQELMETREMCDDISFFLERVTEDLPHSVESIARALIKSWNDKMGGKTK